MPPKTEISQDDTYALLHHEIMENGLNQDAIRSMNDFYKIGLPQILRHVFRIEEVFTNTRTKTPEDRAIARIRFRIEFDNIRLKSPITSGFSSGKEKIIYPLQATLEDRTFSSGLVMDAHIEAWAYEANDGKVHHREAKVLDHRFANLPTMVKTDPCTTHGKSKEILEMLRENPHDEGGYFVGNGKEWSIDNMESVAYNQERIFINFGHRNEKWRVEFISKPGDTYMNSKQAIFRGISGGGITIELGSTMVKGIQFPFYMIFRALGVSTDKVMFDYILHAPAPYPVDKSAAAEPVSQPPRRLTKLEHAMYVILQDAMHADYNSKTQKFDSPIAVHAQAEVLEYLVRHLPREAFHEMDLAREDHLHQVIVDFRAMLDSNMPHQGEDESARIPKARSLGRLIRRALLVELGLREETDRNSYRDKRIHTPGVSSAKILKTHFGHVQAVARKQLIKDFKSMSFAAVNLQQSFKISFNGSDLERLMLQSITSGNQASLVVNKVRRIVNRLSSQLRDNKNQLKNISTGRMIISPSADTNKSSDQAKLMRMPHPSFQGFACLIQSPEGGEKVGLHKQIALGASISTYGSSELLKKQILADTVHVRPLAEVHSYEMDIWRPVLVNGEWFACTDDTAALVWDKTQERRGGIIDAQTTIQWDNVDDEVLFWVDYGRMLRPLHIVVNNVRDWKFLGLKEPADYKDFEQHIVMTKDILALMRAGKVTMQELFAMGVFEWITPAEQLRLDIAVDLTLLQENRHNPLRQFTHCDIPESMLGVAALTGILNNCNHTPRNTFQTSQVRQAGSIYVTNWAYRVDKDTFLQYQVGRPLTFSRVNQYITSNGDNCIVAVMTYSGYNEEDSTVWNKWASERLKYNGSWFTYDKVELDKTEMFSRPDISRTTGIKKYARYTKLGKDGIIPVGTVVIKNDVVVGKIRRLTKQVAAERKMEFQDSSLIYKSEFPSIVHSVVIAKDDNAVTFVKIGYRSLKPIIIGDKFSARSGQKSICGLNMQQADMPFMEDGTGIHILMNPHSFPKRMTNGQIFESEIGSICAKRGVTCDLTTFRKIEMDDIIEESKSLGLEPFGRRRIYSGITGMWLDALIFTGVVHYQRLQKFVARQIYSIDIGPTDIITRQPLDGKANQGGLRISELQRDVFLSHGAARFFSEKMFNDSDDFIVDICHCGNRAILNEEMEIYSCPECGDMAEIVEIRSCWTSKQLFMELAAMGVGTRIIPDPPTYYV